MSRGGRTLLVIVVTIGCLLAAAEVVAIAIHVVLLKTDRFNWLEKPTEKPAGK